MAGVAVGGCFKIDRDLLGGWLAGLTSESCD